MSFALGLVLVGHRFDSSLATRMQVAVKAMGPAHAHGLLDPRAGDVSTEKIRL